MENETFIQKLKHIPVPVLPTLVGAATLSNVYAGLGFSWIRHITMIIATIALICYIVKIAVHPKTFLKEYGTTVPASLYAAFAMLFMILGSYYFDFSAGIGKAIWFVGVILHALHILIFTVRYVILSRSKDTFVPSWFIPVVSLVQIQFPLLDETL